VNNYSEITASAETDSDHSGGFDPSVSQSKSSHFVTKSPPIYRKHESGNVKNPVPDFVFGIFGILPLKCGF
jgi:hypothetical protein